MKDFPIYFTFDRNYVLGACVTFHSLLKHLSKEYFCHLYVLHTKLKDEDFRRLRQVVDRFENAELQFIDVSAYNEKLAKIAPKAHYSNEIFYKLIAADVFPQYDRIILSDVDVIFKDDLAPLIELYPDDDFYFAGVGVVEKGGMDIYAKYFTNEEFEVLEHEIAAGLLVMNLKKIREDNMQKELLDCYMKNYHRFSLPEQDCIVLTCWPHIKYVPLRFTVPNSFYSIDMTDREFYKGNTQFACSHEEAMEKYNDALAHPIQLHYVGFNKPWNAFFVTKQKQWFKELAEAKCIMYYIRSMPHNLIAVRLKRYNIKRFIGKIKKRIFK